MTTVATKDSVAIGSTMANRDDDQSAPATPDYVRDLHQQREQCEETLDEHLLHLAQQNKAFGDLNYQELTLFQMLGWDKDRVQREIHRARSALRIQKAAGTPSQRVVARQRAIDAEAIANARLPQIEGEIRRLESESRSIRHEAITSLKASEAMEEARQEIRKYAPKYLAEEHRQRLVDLQKEHEDLTKLKTDMLVLESMKKRGVPRRLDGHVYQNNPHWKRVGLRVITRDQQTPIVDDSTIPEAMANIAKEIKVLSQQIAPLQAAFDAEKDELDKLLDHYLLEDEVQEN